MSFTFVTALYEISREKHDQRSYQEYQTWFERTLSVPVPMVIYTEECNREIVNRARSAYERITKVIYTELCDVPFYHTTDQVEHIIKNTSFKERIQYPHGLENRCFEYIPIIHSKYRWMRVAAEANFFNTDMFFWIDAGISRFVNFDMAANVFNTTLLSAIHNENKIYIQGGKVNEFVKVLNDEMSLDEAVGKNINFMMAGFWGCNTNIIIDICKTGEQMYVEDLLQKEQVDNEQVTFGFILKKYKEQLLCIMPNRINYINYYIFCNKNNV